MDTIKEIVAEMYRVAKRKRLSGIDAETVEEWATRLEDALDDMRYSDD